MGHEVVENGRGRTSETKPTNLVIPNLEPETLIEQAKAMCETTTFILRRRQ